MIKLIKRDKYYCSFYVLFTYIQIKVHAIYTLRVAVTMVQSAGRIVTSEAGYPNLKSLIF